jgi:hypothetical protein
MYFNHVFNHPHGTPKQAEPQSHILGLPRRQQQLATLPSAYFLDAGLIPYLGKASAVTALAITADTFKGYKLIYRISEH